MSDGPRGDDDQAPASPGVTGEQPNRFQDGGFEPLDETPEGRTPADTTESSEESLPPGADPDDE